MGTRYQIGTAWGGALKMRLKKSIAQAAHILRFPSDSKVQRTFASMLILSAGRGDSARAADWPGACISQNAE